jgi:acetoin utilization deacetylase AcuC-like enzyme
MTLRRKGRYLRRKSGGKMKTVYTEQHALHAPEREYLLGEMAECFEKPARALYVRDAVKVRVSGTFLPPENFPRADIVAVHDPAYVDFLQNGHAAWAAAGYTGDAFGSSFNVQHPGSPPPRNIDGQLGFYTAGGSVPLTKTSWEAIESAAFTALTAQKLVAGGERAAFALCRPPGHHASRACAAGYCYLNNAAIAAQKFISGGAKKVAVLDVDYHHGNGTQEIFYARADVLFASLHADPQLDYPYFLGHGHEKGRGAGEGFNFNYPLPFGTAWAGYEAALQDALSKISVYGPDALVVSLGVDTYEKDPISQFRLKDADYARMGAAIATLKKPTLFVLEGGYAVEEIGVNVANVLSGFES